ncbi:MAG: T9SS type A sorting domain-containing protein [Chitinophagales bacterium]
MKFFTLMFLFFNLGITAQTYTSYFTGDTTDVNPPTLGGVCLMGGSVENENGMAWFLEHANGGDVLVIRATGSNGYNDYMYNDFGIAINSVETIVINSLEAASEPYVAQQIAAAEALWIAGGDQYDYVSKWRNTPVEMAINTLINEKNAVVGGTSAGMAILGSSYFSAANGTVTSWEALSNPYSLKVALGHDDFIEQPFLQDVICDSHYDNPSRIGRHIVFMARMKKDEGIEAKGIACDEYTAVCIDTDGKAYVFGEYPSFDDYAYFIQANCVEPSEPELCLGNTFLTWDRSGQALKAYVINAEPSGTQFFDLNTWEYGEGGEWQDWSVVTATLNFVVDAAAADCNDGNTTYALENQQKIGISLYPNPAKNEISVYSEQFVPNMRVEMYNLAGKMVLETKNVDSKIDVSHLQKGIYMVKVVGEKVFFTEKIVLQQ